MAVRRDQRDRDRARFAAELRLGATAPLVADLSICLAYPNVYPVAMANLGFQAVVDLLARHRVAVDRAFLPDADPGLRVLSFERELPLDAFPILAFSISFEADYVHVLDMLAAAGLPLRAADRDARHPLIVAGGPATFLNPEPLAPFVDLFLIGEAEEMVPEWLVVLRQAGGAEAGRDALLEASASVEGAYAPALHRPEGLGLENGFRVRRRWIGRLDDHPTQTRILTDEAVFGDMMLVEASRGCEWGCRFCAAGFMYRPVRHRSAESLRKTVFDDALPYRKTVGLVGAEMASQPGIAALCREISDQGGRASPSSLKADLISPELANALGAGRTRSVTVAPEAGSERLRRVLNKNLTEEEILRAAELVAGGGVKSLKLYSMIGLPTETEADVTAIADLAGRIRERLPGGVGRILLSINPFVPKPWTPFQWEPMAPIGVLRERVKHLRRLVGRIPGARVDIESPRDAYWQTLLSRGDRRVGDIIEEVHRAGGRHWPILREREHAHRANSGKDHVPPPSFWVERRIPLDEILPWEFIDHGIDKRYLQTEWRKAKLERETAPCDVATCHACSAC